MNQLYEWYQLCEQLRVMKERELVMREELFASHFPEPTEGTNRIDIQGGELVAVYPMNYALDTDCLEAGLEHIPVTKREKIISWQASLALGVYNGLTAKARKAFTAECVTITPGTPSLTIVPTAAEE